VNETEEAPAGTVTEEGTASAAEFEARVTALAEEAVAVRVTVQALAAPAVRDGGLHCRDDNSTAGSTVRAAVRLTPP
jgi:hypothetical protein